MDFLALSAKAAQLREPHESTVFWLEAWVREGRSILAEDDTREWFILHGLCMRIMGVTLPESEARAVAYRYAVLLSTLRKRSRTPETSDVIGSTIAWLEDTYLSPLPFIPYPDIDDSVIDPDRP